MKTYNKYNTHLDKHFRDLEHDFAVNIRPFLVQATPQDYLNWLAGFVTRGGIPTHRYNYPMPGGFYIAKADIHITEPYCGALAFQVIVPVGIQVKITCFTHCALYFMDGFDYEGHWVPVYTNTPIPNMVSVPLKPFSTSPTPKKQSNPEAITGTYTRKVEL